ncbi:MAG: hypothetical protein IPK44_24325 [Candidatus Accumulibacter sp.]|uniref:hypothetical protein n=1 Tax=Accumulibacter sp. TaxID=2053492 RepID=UPI00258F8E44|nr:hypothetical protein [Accumulibacter sp.]MBK8117417.1 hypothetical protein [Accumulibacter sp.]
MTYFTHHSQCPKCAEIGKDNNGDNLAHYSDGSSYCFSCHFSTNKKYLPKKENKEKPPISFPTDGLFELTVKEVKDYCNKYNLTEDFRRKNLIVWSPYWERLCFPIFDDTGLIAWQGRSFNPEKSKWFSQGDLKSILHILGTKQTNCLVLVEDIVSSIILSQLNLYKTSPLFGSHLAIQRLQRYRLFGFYKFILWLDKDKEKDSLKYSYKARQLGFDCVSLVTEKDPKDYDEKTIKNLLTERLKYATLN